MRFFGRIARRRQTGVVNLKKCTPVEITKPAMSGKQRTGKPQGSGPKAAWAKAEEYAQAHGITRAEARTILTRKKKEAMAEAMKKVEKLK